MNSKTEIYQLCPHSGYLMHSYLIKTPNNKIIIIDGGNNYYMEKMYLPHAIRAVLGLKENEYFEIEALFLSHGHIDHYGEFIMMMKEYDQNSNYKINNFYFDFPDFENSNYDKSDYSLENLALLKDAFDIYMKVNNIKVEGRYFDALNGAIINKKTVEKGLSFNIDGVIFDILQTWDDNDDMINGNSLIMKVYEEHKKGRKCLFLNDASVGAGKRLLNTCKDKLKSDIVQISHHGQAGVDKDVYFAIDATVRLWPTTIWLWKDHKIWNVDETRGWFGIEENNYTENDILACNYKEYPKDYTSVSDWKSCVDFMKISL